MTNSRLFTITIETVYSEDEVPFFLVQSFSAEGVEIDNAHAFTYAAAQQVAAEMAQS